MAAEERRKTEEENAERERLAKEAERLAALIQQRDDLERQQEALQKAQQETLANEQILTAKRARYNAAFTAAQRAADAFERDLAIGKYSEALAIFPDDAVQLGELFVGESWRASSLGWDIHETLYPSRREIKITWNTGFTDLLTVMPDTRRLEGKNNLGMPVWAARE